MVYTAQKAQPNSEVRPIAAGQRDRLGPVLALWRQCFCPSAPEFSQWPDDDARRKATGMTSTVRGANTLDVNAVSW